ncbi:hypothetical protein LCGC14_1003170 [marine sediment metagenome]|uniref:Uncharacterized protein n=1 Tax=marine sediment metagenome TaxID=412755 RepID=A0A0F9NNZ1_9ZZZZ
MMCGACGHAHPETMGIVSQRRTDALGWNTYTYTHEPTHQGWVEPLGYSVIDSR